MIITTDESLGQCLWNWMIEQNKNRVLNYVKKDTEFITVTHKDSGKPILINRNTIESIHEDWSGETRTVWIETAENSYGILESMDFFRGILA